MNEAKAVPLCTMHALRNCTTPPRVIQGQARAVYAGIVDALQYWVCNNMVTVVKILTEAPETMIYGTNI